MKTKKKRPPEPLSPNEVMMLVDECSTRVPTGLRNRALIVMLWRSGLRIAEALSLRVADVDRVRLNGGKVVCTLRVLHGKGDKARTAHMDRIGIEYLDRWLDARSALELPPSAPLFCTLNGQQLSTAYIRQLLPRLAYRAGIQKRVHAHGLRHTHAAELRREGIDIGAISKQLGHSSISTTARYLDHIAPEDVAKAIASRKINK